VVLTRLALLLVVALATLAGAGCGRGHLFYDTRELRHEPMTNGQKRALAQTVAGRVGGRSITWVDGAGNERAVDTDSAALAKLPLPELGALWLATATGDKGGENDLRVQLARKPSAAVSVIADLEGNLRIISPPASGAPAREGPVLSEDELRQRFGLQKDMPGTWGTPERRALADALAALSSAELRLVRAVVFDRRTKSRDGDLSRAALYEQKGCRAVIYLYATGVQSDRYRFVGEPSAPRSATLHSILHEIGHAIEQAGSRSRYCAAERARGNNAKNRLIREGNRLLLNSPVLADYLDALDGEPAPTDYGATSPHESFAESFALFHVDPAALERTRPRVYEWFKGGGHLESQPSS
jgi:hypothetical protein